MSAFKKSKSHQGPAAEAARSLLSIAVASDAIEAVVLRRAGERVELVQGFVLRRSRRADAVSAESLALALPDLKTTEDADYTLEVGDGSAGGGASFLPSEFAGLGARKGEKPAAPAAHGTSRPFATQFEEILRECEARGYGGTPVAFTIGAPDVAYVELQLPLSDAEAKAEDAARKASENGKPTAPEQRAPATVSAADRKRLLALLAEKLGRTVEDDRVAFLPLLPSATHRRAMALVAQPGEPVAATLALLREKATVGLPPTRLLESEMAAYASFFRHTSAAAPGERSVIVRVGSEDTLVLFFDGRDLLHGERIRSVTAYDLPETVCSRVLLQQDEKKIGDIHHVLVVGTARSEKLLERFERFYPDAVVEPLEHALRECGLHLSDTDDDPLRTGVLSAVVTGVGALAGWDELASGNLLPKTLRRRQRRRVGVTWYAAVAAVALVLAVAVAGFRYVATQNVLEQEREELRLNPPALPSDDPGLLQARVDSLNAAYTTYTRALHVLDSLLVGSDKWIQAMSRVTQASASTGRLWISSWWPENGQLRLKGHALDRLTIVELARRLNAPLELLNYEDIGERRVYTFEMVTTVPEEMPEVANFLRAIAEGTLPHDSTGTADRGPLQLNPSEAARASD